MFHPLHKFSPHIPAHLVVNAKNIRPFLCVTKMVGKFISSLANRQFYRSTILHRSDELHLHLSFATHSFSWWRPRIQKRLLFVATRNGWAQSQNAKSFQQCVHAINVNNNFAVPKSKSKCVISKFITCAELLGRDTRNVLPIHVKYALNSGTITGSRVETDRERTGASLELLYVRPNIYIFCTISILLRWRRMKPKNHLKWHKKNKRRTRCCTLIHMVAVFACMPLPLSHADLFTMNSKVNFCHIKLRRSGIYVIISVSDTKSTLKMRNEISSDLIFYCCHNSEIGAKAKI